MRNMLAENFHFAEPFWFWGILAIPCILLLYVLLHQWNAPLQRLHAFADAHLLPHLMLRHRSGTLSFWKSLILWSLIWLLGIIALAGPRWNYVEIEAFEPDNSMVILLDLSRSMGSEDIRPSRIERARQEIIDILNLQTGIKTGLIAFAAVPHMISPITDDKDTLRHLLPAIDLDLVRKQGTLIHPALTMARRLLAMEPGKKKAILLMSDGGFAEDTSQLLFAVKSAAKEGIVIHTMGFGTEEGAPIPHRAGHIRGKDGKPVITRLNSAQLGMIAKEGGGVYTEATFLEEDTKAILSSLEDKDAGEKIALKYRQWEERFYLLVPLMLLLMLPFFRRRYHFPLVLFCTLFPSAATADDLMHFFKNKEQQGMAAYQQGDYDTAFEKFSDPYRRGVVQFRKGNYQAAEELFRQNTREETAQDAAYNLGNSLLMQKKYKEAIATYEQLLNASPDHKDAQHNLALAKELVKKQEQKQQQKKNQNQKQEKEQQKPQTSQNSARNQEKEQQEQRNTSQSQQQDEQKKEEGQMQKNQQEHTEKEEQQTNNNPPPQKTGSQEKPADQPEQQPSEAPFKNAEERRADLLLNRIGNNPKDLLRNQFFLEEQKTDVKEETSPW